MARLTSVATLQKTREVCSDSSVPSARISANALRSMPSGFSPALRAASTNPSIIERRAATMTTCMRAEPSAVSTRRAT